MMASFTLPYFADEASLPAALTTAEEIESAAEILSERMSAASGKVVGVGDHFVVKMALSSSYKKGRLCVSFSTHRTSLYPVSMRYIRSRGLTTTRTATSLWSASEVPHWLLFGQEWVKRKKRQ